MTYFLEEGVSSLHIENLQNELVSELHYFDASEDNELIPSEKVSREEVLARLEVLSAGMLNTLNLNCGIELVISFSLFMLSL